MHHPSLFFMLAGRDHDPDLYWEFIALFLRNICGDNSFHSFNAYLDST